MSNRGTFVGFYGSWGSGIAQAARNCSGGTSSARRKRNAPPSPAAHFHQAINGNRSGLRKQKGGDCGPAQRIEPRPLFGGDDEVRIRRRRGISSFR